MHKLIEEECGTPLNDNDMTTITEMRTIRLFGDVNNEMDYAIWAGLRLLESDSITEPITILLNSPGGGIYSMCSVIDAIELCSCPVRIIGTGMVMSAAVPILAAGEPGFRFIAPRTRLLLHPPRIVIAGISKNAEIALKETKILHKMYKDCLLKTTKMDSVLINQYVDNMQDNYFSATTSVKLGIADKVLRSMP